MRENRNLKFLVTPKIWNFVVHFELEKCYSLFSKKSQSAVWLVGVGAGPSVGWTLFETAKKTMHFGEMLKRIALERSILMNESLFGKKIFNFFVNKKNYLFFLIFWKFQKNEIFLVNFFLIFINICWLVPLSPFPLSRSCSKFFGKFSKIEIPVEKP